MARRPLTTALRRRLQGTSTAGLIAPACNHRHAAVVILLPDHRCHDVRALMRRWRAVARGAKAAWHTLATVAGVPVCWLESPPARTGGAAFYLSAGVHGDEAGAAAGLLTWAEANVQRLREQPFLIFPCLNPHGLMLNTRTDHRGLDLNRRFHLEDDPVCGPWRRAVAARPLRLGLCLHEDYDAQGCYVYELGLHPQAVSHDILRHCAHLIPADARARIDGRRADRGVIRRRTLPTDLPGLPEAIVLHQLGCPVTLTFETPSEFSLDDRVAAQVAFIDAALKLTSEAGIP